MRIIELLLGADSMKITIDTEKDTIENINLANRILQTKVYDSQRREILEKNEEDENLPA